MLELSLVRVTLWYSITYDEVRIRIHDEEKNKQKSEKSFLRIARVTQAGMSTWKIKMKGFNEAKVNTANLYITTAQNIHTDINDTISIIQNKAYFVWNQSFSVVNWFLTGAMTAQLCSFVRPVVHLPDGLNSTHYNTFKLCNKL